VSDVDDRSVLYRVYLLGKLCCKSFRIVLCYARKQAWRSPRTWFAPSILLVTFAFKNVHTLFMEEFSNGAFLENVHECLHDTIYESIW
jgi:hypothetical protein